MELPRATATQPRTQPAPAPPIREITNMDSPGSSLDGNVDLSKLSDKDKAELQQFVVNESQKARIQQTVHNLTDTCWKKCVTGSIRSAKLDKGEETCAQNCVERFMDANFLVLRNLEKMRGTQ